MSLFRRLAPTLAALLAVLVVVQMTDLVACADEADAAEHADATHLDGIAGVGHPTLPPGDTHNDGGHGHDDGSFADCLCHVVFTPTAIAPSAEAARRARPAQFGAYVAAPPEVEPSGLDHVPLG